MKRCDIQECCCFYLFASSPAWVILQCWQRSITEKHSFFCKAAVASVLSHHGFTIWRLLTALHDLQLVHALMWHVQCAGLPMCSELWLSPLSKEPGGLLVVLLDVLFQSICRALCCTLSLPSAPQVGEVAFADPKL
jgi:hypothetical protein